MLVIRGGTVVTPSTSAPADVVIGEDGRIEGVVPAGSAGIEQTKGNVTVDAGGLFVLPGMVDAHVHLQEPGREDWEGLDSGTAAAAAGGVTTVVDMPIDCDPPTITVAAVAAKAEAVRRHSRVDVAMWGGLVPASVAELDAMADAGVAGFKAFACPSGWDDFPPVDEPALRAGMAVAARRNLPVAVHCELAALGHGIDSEVAAVRWAARLASEAGARLHVVHASSAAAVVEARRWPGVTVETCAHYLLLDDQAGAHCFPPIRDAENQAALWKQLHAGAINCLASDHSPCPPSMKPGWAGLEEIGMTLPLLLSRLAMPTLVRLATTAATILRLPAKGSLTTGADGDIVLVDPMSEWDVGTDTLWTRHRMSPFAGWRVRGRVVRTFVRGRTVFTLDDGPGPPGGGMVVRPSA